MKLIDADMLIQNRTNAGSFHPDMFVIGQGYVMDAPSVDAIRPVYAKWVDRRCTNCAAAIPTDNVLDYMDESDCLWCYNCGAKMDLK